MHFFHLNEYSSDIQTALQDKTPFFDLQTRLAYQIEDTTWQDDGTAETKLAVKAGKKKSLKVTWKKLANIKGYEIQYATNKNSKVQK